MQHLWAFFGFSPLPRLRVLLLCHLLSSSLSLAIVLFIFWCRVLLRVLRFADLTFGRSLCLPCSLSLQSHPPLFWRNRRQIILPQAFLPQHSNKCSFSLHHRPLDSSTEIIDGLWQLSYFVSNVLLTLLILVRPFGWTCPFGLASRSPVIFAPTPIGTQTRHTSTTRRGHEKAARRLLSSLWFHPFLPGEARLRF